LIAVGVLFLLLLIVIINDAKASSSLPAAPASKDPYDHLRLGRRALDEGRLDEANVHLTRALAFAPASPAILTQILRTVADDENARTLWSHRWCAANADAEGRFRAEGEIKKLLADDTRLKKIAFARARAVAELTAFAAERQERGARASEEYLTAQWARRLAVELAAPSPALAGGPARGLDTALDVPERIYTSVIKALEVLLKSSLSNERTDEAIRAARILHGLGVQADFKDLKGPRPPGMEKIRRIGTAGMARAREQIARKVGEPLTVEQLELLARDEGEEFTRRHDSFSLPGVAVSPKGRYRVETDCGYETLMGVASTIELHHARLVGWYGRDPFEKEQGIVRIVPEAHGLESEGTPFWWAGGMQGGRTTTMRFSCGSIEGLGHGLTHELTHRFDGAIFPGLPLWLLEGRAVWTGGAYGASTDRAFVKKHVSFGTIEATFVKGYGGLKKLTELIEGDLEDYRDNYSAGYALYVYLNTWEEEGRLLYADRLLEYMKNIRKGRNSKKFFEKHFADGKEGRPKGLAGFAAGFQEFTRGFYWKTRQPWTKLYTTDVPVRPAHRYVYDRPTWTWSRLRAEPFFGQDQAREAGHLLIEAGHREDGIRALVWGLSADGRFPEAERTLARTLKEIGRHDGAWVMEQMNAFPFATPQESAPFLAALRQTRILLASLEEAAAGYAVRGLDQAAAVIRADRDRLASWLGLPPATPLGDGLPERTLRHPFDKPARHAGVSGWEEADLFGYEEFRVKNLWFATDSGDLHVGRKKPRKGTGLLDRAAHRHHAFALAGDPILPGAYRIKTRIKFTTSYVAGAVVFGSTRRDHNIRFQFSAGDLMYAIGEKEEEPQFKKVNWHLHGRRQRDGALQGSVGRGGFEFEKASPAFDLELLVEGAAVQAFINGERVAAYHTVDGAPIEGRLGFAASFGAFCAQRPVVERLDRSRLAGLPGTPPLGLDLARGRSRGFKKMRNLPVFGLPPASQGTLLLWIPMPWLGSGGEFDPDWVQSQALYAAGLVDGLMTRERVVQEWAVAIPRALGKERVAALKKELGEQLRHPPRVVVHGFPGWTEEGQDSPDEWQRWIIFLDSLNLARVVQPYETLHDGGFGSRLKHWLTVFRR
jgi:hypothetical protein